MKGKQGNNSKHRREGAKGKSSDRDRRSNFRSQPTKDSRTKRVNFDNARVGKVERDIEETISKGSNDIRWYTHNPELLKSAASLQFYNVTGAPLPGMHKEALTPTIPGVMAIQWAPSIGGEFNDAVNQAKESLYSYVVHANSRNTRYDSTDLMLVTLAGMQLFSAIAWGVRVYAYMRTFNEENLYSPSTVIRAMGFNYADLKTKLPNMWFDLNEMISRSSQIWIPNTMPLLERWYWLNSSVYADAETSKAQYYVFAPSLFWKYSETSQETGGSLEPVRIPDPITHQPTLIMGAHVPGGVTWDQYVYGINSMFDALLNSQDRGIMFGDILKAYGQDKLFALQPMNADIKVVPIYDREVLWQIENLTVWQRGLFDMQVRQDPNTNKLYTYWGTDITGDTSTTPIKGYAPTTGYLNFHQKEAPTPEQIMIATRLRAQGFTLKKDATGAVVNIHPTTCGTEIVLGVVLHYNHYNSSGKLVSDIVGLDPTVFDDTYKTNYVGFIERMSLWTKFDWAPAIYMLHRFPAGEVPLFGHVIEADFVSNAQLNGDVLWDFDNYTDLTVDMLNKLHTTAIYSLFGVPIL